MSDQTALVIMASVLTAVVLALVLTGAVSYHYGFYLLIGGIAFEQFTLWRER